MPKWLNKAVFYEIYPQSFKDSNGDGIGDFNGIIEKLPYIKSLGCNAIWMNPCFDSPFKDAGYDVRDYKKTAERYGTNDDLKRLFDEAHKLDIHVILDLVPGHTSEEHEWFLKSAEAEPNEYSGRFIWTDFCFEGAGNTGYAFTGGEYPRSATYISNFFKCQPALNYGWLHPTERWQVGMDHPDAIATREAIKDVMRFWLDLGCDGFRCDMAPSLVKGDDEVKSGTCAVWTDIRKMLDEEYPEAALVAEWGNPSLAVPGGFHADFLLNDFRSGFSTLYRDYQNHSDGIIIGGPGFTGTDEPVPEFEDHSYFLSNGGGDITAFLADYMPMYEKVKDIGYISLVTCNHDTVRPTYNLNDDELKLMYAFLFTMPGVPFLYYGDEIGMRYLNLPTKEGGYFRTGSRTPMQWSSGKNLGFSSADADALYLPVDSADDAPTVEAQENDSESILNFVKKLLNFRAENADLDADSAFEVIHAEAGDPLFAYRRGSMVILLNPSDGDVKLSEKCNQAVEGKRCVFSAGTGVAEGNTGKNFSKESFAIFI